jgi:hypothetical protein
LNRSFCSYNKPYQETLTNSKGGILIMVNLENVEKLREYADVTYDEAREALEKADGDLLQAIIDLERQGKVKEPEGGGKFISQQQETKEAGNKEKTRKASGNGQDNPTFNQTLRRFMNWVAKIIRKGNTNSMVVEKNGEVVMNLPITIVIILLLVSFWVVVPLLIIGLFFNFRYYFAGPDLGNDKVNDAMDSVANAAEEIKKDIRK